ncbi:hypothetical protein [Spiroplasma endosymbiont of Agriotes lineatus]|uniref:hypothetical protein n=1 Tax=Spiroplasma endosymbiont of Agriotes lineatus TaxID=3077930 RepID=UPI0030D1E2D5
MNLLGAWGIIGFIAMILLGIELVFAMIWSLDHLIVNRKKAVKATSIEKQDKYYWRSCSRNKVIIC